MFPKVVEKNKITKAFEDSALSENGNHFPCL